MATEHEVEVEGIFSMLNPSNSQYLELGQVNHLLHKLETLSTPKLELPPLVPSIVQRETDQDRLDTSGISSPSISPKLQAMRKAMNNIISPGGSRPGREKIIRKDNSLVIIKRKTARNMSYQSTQYKDMSPQESIQDIAEEAEVERQAERHPEKLKSFPNEKQAVSFKEFSGYCDDALVNQPVDDEILMKCFSMFDFKKKGIITPAVIKEVFKVFNEEISEQDAENLLRFLGCNDEMMTFHDVKHFFKKNL